MIEFLLCWVTFGCECFCFSTPVQVGLPLGDTEWKSTKNIFQDKECWTWAQQCAVSQEAPLGISPFPTRAHVSSLKSLIRHKVWISYHQNPNTENLNCHIYLRVRTFKETQILLELSQLSYLVTFPMQAMCQCRFSGSLLWKAVSCWYGHQFWAVDSESLWRCHTHRSAQGQQGAWDSGQGLTPLMRALTFFVCWMIFIIFNFRGDKVFFPTWNCCCGSWKQSCNSELLCPAWVSWGGCAPASSVFLAFLGVCLGNLSYFCQSQHRVFPPSPYLFLPWVSLRCVVIVALSGAGPPPCWGCPKPCFRKTPGWH